MIGKKKYRNRKLNRGLLALCMIVSLTIVALLPNGISVQAEETQTLGLEVTYPSDLSCGVPITFTCNATNTQGSTDIIYHLDAITLYENNNSGFDVVDPTKLGAYQSDNQYTFTFYTSGRYMLRFSVMDRSSTPIRTKTTRVFLTISDANYPSVENIVEGVAQECLETCDTDYEKALFMHDYLVDHAKYDHSLWYCNAEGVLARGKGTCESYHRAFTKLLNAVGVQTGRIVGNGHVWTAVQMDGKWYQIDVTWDDDDVVKEDTPAETAEIIQHLHFGLTDETTTLVHSDHRVNAGYESYSYENNYFIQSGKIKNYSDTIKEQMLAQMNAGADTFTVDMSANPTYPHWKTILYPIAAYQLSNKELFNGKKVYVAYDRATQIFTGAYYVNASELTCSLSKTKYTYSGSACKPAVTVRDRSGNVISSANYSLTYKNNVNAGAASVTVIFKGKYLGAKTLTYTIVPKTTSLSSVYNSSDGITLKWAKNSQATGYRIYRSVNGGAWKHIKTTTGLSYLDKSAVNGAKYQYRLLTYRTVSGKNYYSGYSSTKTMYRLTRPTISSLTKYSKAFSAKWGKNTKVTGYLLQYSTSSTFSSGNKTINVKGSSTLSKKISKLKGSKKYYVRVRCYKTVGGVNYYSAWSSVKYVTTKK